jgi:hypothetical protein
MQTYMTSQSCQIVMQYLTTSLHGITVQKTMTFIFIAMKTSNLMSQSLVYFMPFCKGHIKTSKLYKSSKTGCVHGVAMKR